MFFFIWGKHLKSMRLKGSAYPVYVDGVRYASMFQASIDSGISYKTLYFKIRDNEGKPILVKGLILCDEEWVKKNPKEWEKVLSDIKKKERDND